MNDDGIPQALSLQCSKDTHSHTGFPPFSLCFLIEQFQIHPTEYLQVTAKEPQQNGAN